MQVYAFLISFGVKRKDGPQAALRYVYSSD